MEKKKQDLRVVKTEKSIKKAFSKLILEKPLDKITVTELASLAEINKGTFYLHYADIYALYDAYLVDSIEAAADEIDYYNEFFERPELFAKKIMDLIGKLGKEKVTVFQLNQQNRQVPYLIAAEFKKRLYMLGKIEQSVENDIKLDFILSALTCLALKYEGSHAEQIMKLVATNIRYNFPVD